MKLYFLSKLNVWSLYGSGRSYFLTADMHCEYLTLADSFGLNGFYVFADADADHTRLLYDLSHFLPQLEGCPRFLWAADDGARFRFPHIIFTAADTVSHTWGLHYTCCGAAPAAGAALSCDGEQFILGRTLLFFGSETLTATSGVLCADGTLRFSPSHGGGADIARTGGIAYAFDYEFESPEEARLNGFILTVMNQVIYADCPLTLSVRLNPLDQEPLFIGLPQGVTLESSFTGLSGRQINLRTSSGAGWVLSSMPTHVFDANKLFLQFYPSLTGSFELLFDSACDKIVMPGLSGVEHFDFTGAESNLVAFTSEEASCFGFDGSGASCPWVVYPKGVKYFSQPDDAPLFTPSSDGDGLVFLPVPLLDVDGAVSVPQIFPSEGSLVYDAAETAVYQTRLKQLCEHMPAKSGEGGVMLRAVTKQGLMVGVNDTTYMWHWISLANVGYETERLLCLNNIDFPLRKIFADVDMNLIWDKSGQLAPYVGPSDLFTFEFGDAWSFDLNPAVWTSASLVVVKYSTSATVRELAGGKAALSSALNQTRDRDGNVRDGFERFLEVLDDASFTGVLAVGVRIRVDENRLEGGLKTAWLGIDPNDRANMTAHHLIISHCKLAAGSGTVGQKAAAADALVAYRAGKGIVYTLDETPDYDFKTTALTLAIRNSRLERLTTESELLMQRITGLPCNKEGGNVMILDGAADQTSGLDGFRFTLRDEALYRTDGVLELVGIKDVSLVSDSVFKLDGRFCFAEAGDGECDMYGYGMNSGDDCGLPFAGLKIYKTADGYDMRYSDLALFGAQARPNSFTARFPSGVDGFCYDSRPPGQLSYINIQTPQNQSKLQTPWYGIRYRIPLGSLGDLSGGSVLDLYILTAWSCEGGSYFGVRLPDALFGGGLDVQGVLKLGFDSVVIDAQNEAGRISYTLHLKQFEVRLLWAAFPPGQNEIIITADESGKKLGWLGVYKGDSNGD